ncbi:DUF1624 domain-containing protein [Mesorhizobium sp. YM1C-6-2]|uniref:heparan-alpha-glucosaminide N-acetyltransferase n=1 Tax=Mesorhizobium sp. YM1C-6-2 TaxID=1827501 RepID=UPI001FE0D801|nr:DUF1624 domain-containing protein [Mesorhizobium sp. YM1C-6-2]
MTNEPQPKGRIDAIDIARGTALLAMAIYHFTWDLEFFGYVPPGMTAIGGWKLFARCIASSFLFLVGVGLFLGHARGIRWRGFWRRLAMVAGAALAISIVTYIAVPDGFIFFGILHQITLASLLGLLFLRLPAAVTLIVAAAVIAAPHYLRSPFFDDPWWWWTGLSENRPRSNDYVPVFPWFAAVLAGIAAAKIAQQTGLFARLARLRTPAWTWPLSFGGRHSLAVYLIHQPVLIACIWLFSQIFPAAEVPREVRFLQACEASCREQRDTTFCTRYCGCMLGTLEREGVIESVYGGERSETLRGKVEEIAGRCTVETEDAMFEEGGQ